jgi:hypothetical protein
MVNINRKKDIGLPIKNTNERVISRDVNIENRKVKERNWKSTLLVGQVLVLAYDQILVYASVFGQKKQQCQVVAHMLMKKRVSDISMSLPRSFS